MAATTLTTIVMIAFAVFVLTWAGYTWFGSWQPEVRRLSPQERLEAEYDLTVRQMRQAIEEYERGERSL
ncbi:MAG: hypothetical protein ACLGIF_08355 [Actinomycetes bacterium]